MAMFTYFWLNLDFSSQILQLCKFFSLNDQTFLYQGPSPCFCKIQDIWQIFFSHFSSFIRNYFSYRNVLYLISILLKNWFDHILYMFPLKLIFYDLWAKALVYIFRPQTFLQNLGFLKNTFCKLLVISQKLCKLQRLFIPHFDSLKELIWPNVMHVGCKRDISWLTSQNPSLLFYASDFKQYRHFSFEVKKSGDQFPQKVTTCSRHYEPKLILPLKFVLLYHIPFTLKIHQMADAMV